MKNQRNQKRKRNEAWDNLLDGNLLYEHKIFESVNVEETEEWARENKDLAHIFDNELQLLIHPVIREYWIKEKLIIPIKNINLINLSDLLMKLIKDACGNKIKFSSTLGRHRDSLIKYNSENIKGMDK